MSLLSWERGLKYGGMHSLFLVLVVAPLVGAWIEIPKGNPHMLASAKVAPLVGAWIEIN